MNIAYKTALKAAIKKASKLIANPGKLSALLLSSVNKIKLNKGSIQKIKNELLLLTELIKYWSKGQYKDISTKSILMIVGAIIYFVNPLDIIPDFTPILGFTDDATILYYVIRKISSEIDKFRNWKELQTINNIDLNDKSTD